ncbi:MAG: SDR family oxidoreductase [bacterium]
MSFALVLGATSGAGEAIARALLVDPGLDLVALHRGNHPAAAEALAEAARGAGRRLHARVGEAGTAESAEQALDALAPVVGPGGVRVVVHALACASVGNLVRGGGLGAERIERTFAAMAHSFVYWVEGLHRRGLLAADGARILGLTSPPGGALIRRTGAITAAKAALEIYVRHLAFELGPLGHRVNLISYGATTSAALEHVLDGSTQARLDAAIRRMSPAGRRCTVEDVARLVSFLAREEGAWFNGATIDYSGGEVQSLYDLVLYPEELP